MLPRTRSWMTVKEVALLAGMPEHNTFGIKHSTCLLPLDSNMSAR